MLDSWITSKHPLFACLPLSLSSSIRPLCICLVENCLLPVLFYLICCFFESPSVKLWAPLQETFLLTPIAEVNWSEKGRKEEGGKWSEKKKKGRALILEAWVRYWLYSRHPAGASILRRVASITTTTGGY